MIESPADDSFAGPRTSVVAGLSATLCECLCEESCRCCIRWVKEPAGSRKPRPRKKLTQSFYLGGAFEVHYKELYRWAHDSLRQVAGAEPDCRPRQCAATACATAGSTSA